MSASKEMGVSLSLGKRWWLMYNKHGLEGLLIKSGTYDGKFKVYAVEYMHESHLSINEASAELGIPSKSILQSWERIYYEKGAEGLLQIKSGRPPKNMEKNSKNHLTEKQEKDLIADLNR